MGNKASMAWRHSSRCCATLCASPHVSFISFSSPSTVLCQVLFGRPGLRFPGGVHLNAALGILSFSILRTWPIWVACVLFQGLHLRISLFVILLGQKILQIFLRHWFYSCLLLPLASILSHTYGQISCSWCKAESWSWVGTVWTSRLAAALPKPHELSRALLGLLYCPCWWGYPGKWSPLRSPVACHRWW